MQDLRALGARSVPVVSRGERFVFAQVLRDVVEFLELGDDTAPTLSPAELAERYLAILERAIVLVAQMPEQYLERQLPNRPRAWRVLLHHVFQIPTAFLDAEASGQTLRYEALVAPPGPELRDASDIARFGQQVRDRFARWWQEQADSRFDIPFSAYFGQTSRHEMLERTVWHSTQHVRQVCSLLEQVGVQPALPLSEEHLRGLPLTEKVWD